MTSSSATRAKTLGFRSLLVLGGVTLAVTALALPSKADGTPAAGFTSDPVQLFNTLPSGTDPGPVSGLVRVPVPATALSGDAIELSIATTGSTGSGYVVAYPDGGGATLPGTLDLNYSAGRSVASTTVVGVPTDGVIDVYVHGASTQLVVNELGFFDSSVLTTKAARVGNSGPGLGFGEAGAFSGVETLTLPSADYVAGKPVAINVTVAPTTSAAGSLKIYAGTAAPVTSSLYFGGGLPYSNLVFVTPGADGKISFDVSQKSNIAVDLEGYVQSGSSLVGLGGRLVDTRTAPGAKPITGTHTLTVPTKDAPAGTTGVVLDIISTGQTGNGAITVFTGSTVPIVAAVIYTKGGTIDQTVVVPIATGNKVSVNVSPSASAVIVDTEGYVGAANDG